MKSIFLLKKKYKRCLVLSFYNRRMSDLIGHSLEKKWESEAVMDVLTSSSEKQTLGQGVCVKIKRQKLQVGSQVIY